MILHHVGPRAALVAAEEPADDAIHPDWGGERVYDAVAVSCSISASIDVDAVMEAADVDDEESDELEDALFDLMEIFNKGGHYDGEQPAAQVLGRMSDDQESPEDAARMWGKPGDDWINVLEVGSVGSMVWSDVGTLNFLARRSKVAAGDTSDIIAMISSG